jgi:hypothetical protein
MGDIVGAVFEQEGSKPGWELQGGLLTNCQGLVGEIMGIRSTAAPLLRWMSAGVAVGEVAVHVATNSSPRN